MAAAGIYALDYQIDRLVEDHKKAKEIGTVLQGLSFTKKVEPIETNIIIFEINEDYLSVQDFIEKLRGKDIHIIGMGSSKLRIVTHMDYTDQMHDTLLKTLKTL
jgi:threonine aldolase